jgi:cell division protein FtsQ
MQWLSLLPRGIVLRVGMWLLLILSLWLWFHSWLINPSVWPITAVKIKGNYNHIERQTLQNQILPYTEKGFFGADIHALKYQLEQLPWVAKAQVVRAWPDTLMIQIQEQQLVAYWNHDNFISAQGALFALRQANANVQLPELFGPNEERNLVLLSYQQFDKLLQPLQLRVKMLALSARQSWQIRLDNGLTLLLGRESMVDRLQRFIKIYNTIVGSRAEDIDYIDLRYSNGLAVHWKNGQYNV